MTIRKKVRVVLPAFFLTLLATGHPLAADPKSPPPSPAAAQKVTPAKRTVAATVNGSPIYVHQLDAVIAVQNKGAKLHPSQLDLQRKALLQEAVSSELLYQEALRNKSPELEKKVLAREKELRAKHPELFKGKDPAELRNNIRQNIAIQDYLHSSGIINPEIPEKDLRAMYDKLKGQMAFPESVHVRHILVKIAPNANPEERKKARSKIDEARRAIAGGKPFAETARKYSEDSSAKDGGDMGFIMPGYMPEPFQKVAFSLPTGKLSDVIETKHGFHVLEVLEKKPAGVVTYEEKKDWLRTYLKEQTRAKRMNDLMARLKKKGDVKIHLK